MPREKQKELYGKSVWESESEAYRGELCFEIEDLRVRLKLLKKLIENPGFREMFHDVYHVVVDSVYESLCIGIMRLCDNYRGREDKEVLSILKICQESIDENRMTAKDLEEIEAILVECAEKIKDYRNNYLAHKNREKALRFFKLSKEEKKKFLKEMKPNIEELERALDVLAEVVWRVSKACDVPMACAVQSYIEMEMDNIFESVGCKSSLPNDKEVL